MNWQDRAVERPSALAERDGEGEGPLLGISEVQLQTGLTARTLRYYEELGLLPGVRRRAGGRRVYGPDEVERVRFIQRLKKLGLSLAEIKELNTLYAMAGSTQDMLVRLDELLGRHAAEVTERIGELESLRWEIERYRARIGHRIGAGGPRSEADPS